LPWLGKSRKASAGATQAQILFDRFHIVKHLNAARISGIEYFRTTMIRAEGLLPDRQRALGCLLCRVVRPRLPQCANRMLAMKTRHLDELVEDLLLVASCGSVIALHDRLNAVQGRRSRTKIFIFRRRTAATGRECDY
jgi:hypothetical protein